MPLTINTNMAASQASYYLSKNNDMLQKKPKSTVEREKNHRGS